MCEDMDLLNEKKEERRRQQVETIMNAYMKRRHGIPTGLGAEMEEHKTTQMIVEDLEDMMTLTMDEIVDYLSERGYGYITLEDGSLAWAMWRDLGRDELYR